VLYWTDRGDPPRGNTVNRASIDAKPQAPEICSSPASSPSWRGAPTAKEHAMSQKLSSEIAVIGIDIGKNSFHLVSQVGENEPRADEKERQTYFRDCGLKLPLLTHSRRAPSAERPSW
jgi:hypothetical protein